MDRVSRKPLVATLVALGAIFLLLYEGNSVDFLSDITKPAVIFLLHSLGIDARDAGDQLIAAHLLVPWTGDCAGLNILAILLAVTLWANRSDPFGWAFWLRIALAFPVAFAANLARILTLIALRWFLYPAVESPQLHYFVGFLWVLPFLALVLRKPASSHRGEFWLEILRIATLLSLLAPFISSPGGWLVGICTLVLLLRHRYISIRSGLGIFLYCGWILAGVFIASGRMESLWIPWILCCPHYLVGQPARMLSLALLLPGTIPLLAMKPLAPYFFVPVLLWEISLLFREKPSEAKPADPPSRSQIATTAFFHLFPFLAASAAMFASEPFPPPGGTMAVQHRGNYYSLRIVRQPADLHCYWYEPNEGGRHHSLAVCLQFRGVFPHPEALPGLLSDETLWLRDFYLLPDGTLCDYKSYLAKTFFPFSKNGAHIIYSAPKTSMSGEEFLRLSQENAEALQRLLLQQKSGN